ncbi:SIMPL domain-containing protein [Streptomyces sp. NPDC048696]|uniref:SIMPL domain-containing protein n=1 Tax=Streptomyces sp. NPDC048696 TaxID=3365585 RepID=UPI003713AD23
MTQPSQPSPSPHLPYGTPEAPRIAVRGEAVLDVDPEIARLGVTVIARGTDRRSALEDLTRRNAAVLDLVKSYGDAVEQLETGSFSVSPELGRHGRGERVRAYQGQVRLTAELGDFTALGELASRLAALELTRVDGPWWGLRPASPAYAKARRRAVEQAVERAREYAAALGSDLVALLELADEGAEDARPYPAPAPGMLRTAYGSGAPEPQGALELDLEPQRQTVRAAVLARFTMAPPAL